MSNAPIGMSSCGDPPKSGPLAMLVCGFCGPKRSPDHERQETHDGTEDPHFAGGRRRQTHQINPNQRLTLHLVQFSGPAQLFARRSSPPIDFEAAKDRGRGRRNLVRLRSSRGHVCSLSPRTHLANDRIFQEIITRPNKAPEPTPRPAKIFARSVVFDVVAGVAHL